MLRNGKIFFGQVVAQQKKKTRQKGRQNSLTPKTKKANKFTGAKKKTRQKVRKKTRQKRG